MKRWMTRWLPDGMRWWAKLAKSAKHADRYIARTDWRANEGGAAGGGGRVTNPLEAYFDAHREGPGIWKWRHYFDIYHRHFAKFIGREVHVLEIGIYSGGSLEMWREYFGEGCRVYGVDIEPACKVYEREGVKVFIGDQADRSFWAQVRREVPRLDVVIDDGGHHPTQQRISLEELLPHLSPGGVYFCEDVVGDHNEFAYYVQRLAVALNAGKLESEPGNMERQFYSATSPMQRAVHSVHCYPFVAVVERNDAPVVELVGPKHGTQWQPHLQGLTAMQGNATGRGGADPPGVP